MLLGLVRTDDKAPDAVADRRPGSARRERRMDEVRRRVRDTGATTEAPGLDSAGGPSRPSEPGS